MRLDDYRNATMSSRIAAARTAAALAAACGIGLPFALVGSRFGIGGVVILGLGLR